MGWITVARYTYPYEAHIARGKLDNAGIDAFIADEHTISTHWIYSQALGGVRVQVQEESKDLALRVLAEETNVQDELPERTEADMSCHCPRCSSTALEPALYQAKTTQVLFLLFGTTPGEQQQGTRCRSCGFFWDEALPAQAHQSA